MAIYTNPIVDQEISPKHLFYIDNKCAIFTCNGSPEGVILANTGSIAISDNASIYKKTTDDVNTGWVELQSGTAASPLVVVGSDPTLNFDDTDVSGQTGKITVEGGTPIIFKPNGQIVGMPRNIVTDVSVVGNVGAGLDTLHTTTLPINTLATNNDYLLAWYSGIIGATANGKLLALTYGGTNFFNTGTFDARGGGWNMSVRVIRISATSIRICVNLSLGFFGVTSANVATGGSTIGGITFVLTSAALAVADLSTNTLVLTVQATGVADNDIVQNLSLIDLVQLT